MILLDFNGVAVSGLLAQNKADYKNLDLFRHVVLNSIRSCRTRFSDKFGELVICCDDKYSWRRDVFPYYKQNRRDDRSKSAIDWTTIHQMINTVREEIRETFPYKVLHVPKCEADDIIAVICMEFGKHDPISTDEILIYSTDKDFKQLLHYSNVQQYSPAASVQDYVSCPNPAEFLFVDLILRGDSDDGVPNVKSYDSQLIDRVRQKPITQKVIEEYRNDPELQKSPNYLRNKRLVDFNEIPVEIRRTIMAEYNKNNNNPRKKIFPYMMQHRLDNLLESIGDF